MAGKALDRGVSEAQAALDRLNIDHEKALAKLTADHEKAGEAKLKDAKAERHDEAKKVAAKLKALTS